MNTTDFFSMAGSTRSVRKRKLAKSNFFEQMNYHERELMGWQKGHNELPPLPLNSSAGTLILLDFYPDTPANSPTSTASRQDTATPASPPKSTFLRSLFSPKLKNSAGTAPNGITLSPTSTMDFPSEYETVDLGRAPDVTTHANLSTDFSNFAIEDEGALTNTSDDTTVTVVPTDTAKSSIDVDRSSTKEFSLRFPRLSLPHSLPVPDTVCPQEKAFGESPSIDSYERERKLLCAINSSDTLGTKPDSMQSSSLWARRAARGQANVPTVTASLPSIIPAARSSHPQYDHFCSIARFDTTLNVVPAGAAVVFSLAHSCRGSVDVVPHFTAEDNVRYSVCAPGQPYLPAISVLGDRRQLVGSVTNTLLARNLIDCMGAIGQGNCFLTGELQVSGVPSEMCSSRSSMLISINLTLNVRDYCLFATDSILSRYNLAPSKVLIDHYVSEGGHWIG